MLQEASDRLGGCCSNNGCTETDRSKLQFHHVDPELKDFDIGTMAGRITPSVFWKEVDKCVLLCKPCHHEVSLYGGDYNPHRGADDEDNTEFEEMWAAVGDSL